MRRLAPLIALLCALAGPAAAQAAGLAATQRVLARDMSLAGPWSGAYVVDLGTRAPVYARRPDVARYPASVEKLYTSATALLSFGPAARFTTAVEATGPPGLDGVLSGDLVLHGGGDPTFAAAGLDAAASRIAALGVLEVTGRVLGDESAFDALRGPPSSGYARSFDVGAPLSALTYDRGRTGLRSPYWQSSPPAFAAQAFARALERHGIAVDGAARAGVAPPGAQTLADVDSAPLATLLRRQNVPSDNFMAETLIKAIGAGFGGGGTTARGAAVVRATLARFGVRPQVVDGSGLSRADRTTPRQVATLLASMAAEPTGPVLAASLPVAGRTGTLYRRMRATAAQDRCQAKTGTLRYVSALAGYCATAGGRRVAFAFLMDGVNVAAAHRLQDRMTVALAQLGP